MNHTIRTKKPFSKAPLASHQRLAEIDEKNDLIKELNDINSNKQREIRNLIAQVKRTEYENEQLSRQIENQAIRINDIMIENASTMRLVAMASLILGALIGFYFARTIS